MSEINTNAMQELTIEVNKKVAGKYQPVGKLPIFVPVLAGVFAGLEVAKDKEGKEVMDEDTGLPVYADDRYNYIQDAITAAVKAEARNKLVSGTATLKDGAVIATDWAALTAETQGKGNPDALAAIREVKADFKAWAATLSKSVAAQQTMVTFFDKLDALRMQSAVHKQKIADYVSAFADTLDEAKLTRYGKYLEKVAAVCEVEVEIDDF